ncbi:tape measure protein [Proteus mirabilis]|uniref:tape measure protein n=2 Tax=Proteus mirabilis TaxID=584 RepID=UPI0025767F30|nr:tape measure protein [Proteus mirabilis]MDM3659263.1 phage tail tape measure protein [Proteus mirabilis]MDM3668482.1 phage tail tape measure protein [Proteus mirabilis]HCQ9180004.1 tape measure protein [Proteus mirabilis]HDA9903842.1 tape measure protein [Proteus mirabilis]HEH4197193.1 tape measure protein [Proteus mirabilis]
MANVGEIVYQVQMDVQQLLTSQRQLEQRLNRMDDSFNRTSQSVNNTERSMLSLSKVAASLAGYLSASMVASYSEAWTELNNKLSNSVRASESLIDVTQRVFDISQATRSSLDATATLYARLERGTREYNTSAADLAKLTSIINQGFIVSGATAIEAENAIIQLSQGIASGVLRGEEFNSVAEQGSRLMVALADSMGVGIGQLRKMAAEGKLTTDVVVKGLLSQGDAIGKEFAKTTRTMSQAFQEAGNNLTKFLGENTTIKSTISAFSDAVITVSKNLDELSSVLTVIATVVGSRYVGALAMATKSKVMMAAASRQESVATLQSARASEYAANMSVRKAQADLASARSAVALAQAEYNVAKGTLAEATALDNLIAKKSLASKAAITLTQATQAQTAAMANSAAAARAASLSMGLLRGAMGMLGGPAGVAMLAGAAIYYFYQKSEQAKQEARDFADSIDQLTVKLKELSYQEIARDAQDARDKQELLRLEMKEQENQLSSLRAQLELQKTALNGMPDLIDKNTTRILREVTKLEGDLAENKKRHELITKYLSDAQDEYNRKTKEAIDLSVKSATTLDIERSALGRLTKQIKEATGAKEEFSLVRPKLDYGGAEGEKLLKQMEERLALSKLEGAERAKLKAMYDAKDAGITDPDAIRNLQDLAAQEYENTQAKKEGIKTAKQAASAALKEATEAEKLKQKITDVANATKVAELETKGLAREAAILEAVQKLGSKATKAQVAEITELAGKEFDLKQKIKDRKDAFSQNPEAKANQEYKLSLEQLERQLKGNLVTEENYQRRRVELAGEYSKKIAEANAQASISPIEDNRAQFDPVQQLKNENAKKLALMDKYYADEMAIINQAYANQQISHEQFTTAKQITDAQYLQIRTAQEKKFNEQQTAAQWQMLSQQSLGFDMLTSAVDAMSGSASNAITGLLTGTMTAADAMRSLGNTILNSVVNSIVQTGVEMLKNFIIGKTMGAAAAAASMGEAAIVASAWAPAAAFVSLATMGANAAPANASLVGTTGLASTLAIAGARKNGGPVDAGSMYRVGEGGKPEIFKANNGRQYMIPGDNGKVISNKDMQGDGMNVNVVFNDYSSGGHKFDAQTSQDGNTLTIQAFIMDMDNKGPILQSITRNTSATARARG